MIQVRSNNHKSLTVDNLVTNLYDFAGRVWLTKKYHNAGSSNITTVLSRYDYDPTGRVKKIWQKNNSDAEQLVAAYTYNELGQVVDKQLHCTSCPTSETSFLQSVDYRYNIRGWLASINNSQLTNDGVKNDETNDYFGMELLYNNTESGLNSGSNEQLWNGNISAVKWRGPTGESGDNGQRSYKFTYDKSDRLLQATYGLKKATSDWTGEANTRNEALTYDANGNILTLTRNQVERSLAIVNGLPTVTASTQAIDNLTYTYGNGNQLTKVEDATTNVAGFKNGVNATDEYTYNTKGSITKDDNKGISSITYNILNKPSVINFSDGRRIEYIYDATGNKLTQKLYQGTTLQMTTDYVGGFVYNNGTLDFFGSPEGRVASNGNALEYQYAITDHQGNTRVVFSSVTPEADDPIATFEGNSGDESNVYQNVPAPVTFVGANHTSGGSKVIAMNQNTTIAVTKSVHVYPGDKIDIEVWEYHEGSSGYGSSGQSLSTLITAVAGAFGGSSGAGGESGAIYNGVDAALTIFGPGGYQNSTRPAAYLNYILFDRNYKVLDAGWQVTPDVTFTKQKLSFPTKQITEEGYMFVYLSYENQSNVNVYFDDLKVTHTKSNVIQYNEYYPFGLNNDNSWTRELNKNDFKYNAGSELNVTSGWYEMFFRDYDPAIGRMLQVDPMATKYAGLSVYQYSFNGPIYWNDPSGADSFRDWDQVAGVIAVLWSSKYGGTWSSSSGMHTFTSQSEMQKYMAAVDERVNGGAAGAIVPISDFVYQGDSKTPGAQTTQQNWVKTIVGYKFVPFKKPFSAGPLLRYEDVEGNGPAPQEFVTYPDGQRGPRPKVDKTILDPTITGTWVELDNGSRLYYTKDYKSRIWYPLNKFSDKSRTMYTQDESKFIGWKDGYQAGYDKETMKYVFYTILNALGVDQADGPDPYMTAFIDGFIEGKRDRNTNYANILAPTTSWGPPGN